MAYSSQLKEKAVYLRAQGKSLSEITKELGIVKSTASIWVAKVPLSPDLKIVLKQKERYGREKAFVARKIKKEAQSKLYFKNAQKNINGLIFSKNFFKLMCALLWWCEGNKDTSMVRFTNSDVTLVENFLASLREGFIIDESKFRVLVHIHEYHDDIKQKLFWSDVTSIPVTQFYASYEKPHTGKRKHVSYQGCIAISYYDAKIAKELEALYNAFTLHRGIR